MSKWILSRPDWKSALSKTGDDVPLDSPELKTYPGRVAALAAMERRAKEGQRYIATTVRLAELSLNCGDDCFESDIPF